MECFSLVRTKFIERYWWIIELGQKFNHSIGKKYFKNKDSNNVIELSITPNRPDCLGIRGIARDLFSMRLWRFKRD